MLLAEGAAGAALPLLRAAAERWRALSMPYDVARAGVRVALACRALGDEDAARLELDVACAAFEQLGARTDLAESRALATAPTVGRRASPPGSARCSAWWRAGAPTGRSRPSW